DRVSGISESRLGESITENRRGGSAFAIVVFGDQPSRGRRNTEATEVVARHVLGAYHGRLSLRDHVKIPDRRVESENAGELRVLLLQEFKCRVREDTADDSSLRICVPAAHLPAHDKLSLGLPAYAPFSRRWSCEGLSLPVDHRQRLRI